MELNNERFLYKYIMSVAIVGSRNFVNGKTFYEEVYNALEEWGLELSNIKIISGGAKGADTLIEEFAIDHHIPFKKNPS